MIRGSVSSVGVPMVQVEAAGKTWDAVVDTGFNGDVELPADLRAPLKAKYRGQMVPVLAGGRSVIEDFYEVDFAFDGQTVAAEATFVPGHEILIGTRMLGQHRLEIDFPGRLVQLQRK